MNAPIASALVALRRGDALAVLRLTHGLDDAVAIAARAVALAQLDETRAARRHLRRAERAFEAAGDARQALRARLAEAEVAIADLDLTRARARLVPLARALHLAGDPVNAAWALVLASRAASLQGDAEGAELLLDRCRDAARDRVPPHVEAVLALAEAESSARRLLAAAAHAAAARAGKLARRAGHPALEAEVARVAESLRAPVARLADGRALALSDVAAITSARPCIVVDACHARVRGPGRVLDLARRPVLFAIFAAIAEAAPDEVAADVIAGTVFGARVPNASHRARLRVELGRLRKLVGPELGSIVCERGAVRFDPALPLVVLLPLRPRDEARLHAVLADGRAWPATALAAVVGQSPRTLQRKLAALTARGEITALGKGRARRYALEARAPRIASWMLLAGLAPSG